MDHDFEEGAQREQPDLETTLNALIAGEAEEGMNSVVYYGLSGLPEANVSQFTTVWDSLSPEYRRRVIRDLADVGETNFDLDYRTIGWLALLDADAEVREAAIDLLWEDDTVSLMDRLIQTALSDESVSVRAAAASALGRFILLGEIGDLPDRETARAQDAAIRLLTDLTEDIDVRRRALEAIANSSHEIVVGAIREAHSSPDQRMRISSIFAMGRTCDEQWNDDVLQALESDDLEMRYEAARAAGELGLESALSQLRSLAFDADREIKEAAIWSLGEIGGNEAVRVLQLLAQDAENNDDEELLEAIEDALGNAKLGGDQFYMMRLDD